MPLAAQATQASPAMQLRMRQHITISVADQRLRVWENGAAVREYPISTSKFGLGSEEGSYRTPLGKFRIAGKIGDGLAPSTVFKGRVPVGHHCPSDDADCDADMILSRILRLDGQEPENENTYSRYIYIHGTNDEQGIGSPTSHGCIRMKPLDIIDLYDLVADDSSVEILDSHLPLA